MISGSSKCLVENKDVLFRWPYLLYTWRKVKQQLVIVRIRGFSYFFYRETERRHTEVSKKELFMGHHKLLFPCCITASFGQNENVKT